jgi:hypothetical protein
MREGTGATPRSIEVTIYAETFSADELLAAIKSKYEGQPITLDVRREPATFRQLDPAAVVAIVAATGVVARTFLKGIFDLASERHKQTVTIKGIRDGKEVQLVVPITASNNEIERVIELWQGMAKPQIELSDESPRRS